MREVLSLCARLGTATSPVLIEGESGTGKDLLAHHLHFGSARRQGPLITIHCPSIPEELMEDELFGHERGAFTDARSPRPGRLELAVGGTVYLDHIQELSRAMQGKLLRVVEERRFERLGSTRTLDVDVRFVASAALPLAEAVAAGTFRGDLYHRLSVVQLTLPPLRERPEDILPLAEAFLERERERGGTTAKGFEPAAQAMLTGYTWPGNVRELRGVVERAALLVQADWVGSAQLPPALVDRPAAYWSGREQAPSLRQLEMAYVRHVLATTGGNQTAAAKVLGISRKALWEKRRRYDIP
jgi:DNA-binding NtrC family response regulator